MQDYLNKKKSSGDYGRQTTLPPSLQTKMNQSFGMDFSSVKLYRNDEMSGTGMQGLASGNRVILSKDVDLNSKLGQAVLGHELSHIRAQSQGIGMGNSGLYNNAALEHQADAEGLMAANGQPIFGDRTGMNMGAGMGGFGTLTPLSGGLAANAGAPMQAKESKAERKARKKAEKAAEETENKHTLSIAKAVDPVIFKDKTKKAEQEALLKQVKETRAMFNVKNMSQMEGYGKTNFKKLETNTSQAKILYEIARASLLSKNPKAFDNMNDVDITQSIVEKILYIKKNGFDPSEV